MKIYERPDLEEIELLLEGSFLNSVSNGDAEIGKDPSEPGEGDDWG